MSSPDPATRRAFLLQAGCAAAAGGALLNTSAPAARAAEPADPLARLIEGNRRFAAGEPIHRARTPADFAADAEGQAPFAAIVGCADSRVAPELVFDQGVGDLFVVRVAGNVVSGTGPLLKGSLEFAVAALGARLIVVLGHSKCGALKAAIDYVDQGTQQPGSIGGLVELVAPSVKAAAGQPGDRLASVTRANVQRCVKTLRELDPILSDLATKAELLVVGAVYDLATGRVDFLDEQHG